eukprot:TRINITY_DN27176_c0_g1_i1.p1 TRINITY_DN27176_c0_g1~~TRINITY_DN27176_c0_g1_i1.p1  ORF type:complete len:143 (+),score=40.73 TRINITY_DN27176_c0_g1_i1:1-429(+)
MISYAYLLLVFFLLMIRRPPRSTLSSSSAASDVYKRQVMIKSASAMIKQCHDQASKCHDQVSQHHDQVSDTDQVSQCHSKRVAQLILRTAGLEGVGELPILEMLALLQGSTYAVSYTHLRAHETPEHLVCRLLLEKKKTNPY